MFEYHEGIRATLTTLQWNASMRFVLKKLFTVSAVIVSSNAFAAAFQLYELGTPVIGTAAVGQAVVYDASTSYFNPAAHGAITAISVQGAR